MNRSSLVFSVAAYVLLGAAALLLAGDAAYRKLTGAGQPEVQLASEHPSLHGIEAVFYKSPSCGCCHGYAEALEAAGVRLQVVDDAAAMAQAKARYGVPPRAYSCHTFTLDGYVVEGHVPLEALEKLVTERPRIDGIALPGMPIGTPGMPGTKAAPFEVLSLLDGHVEPYVTL